ncbi:RNA polymerase sigma factor [Spongiactinospora sp. TRM90649]|uniref:RNA polymerase sigma factor n=1 Tax=Spongiactinospora sp. TRM90649 TaxID=3031114 RepID=UPI0023F6D68E|nr:RNA polymerase sigma factor [Spongiactinospora sp. TRM90649]MDF5758267.1 RNA polymerase sigma factor [Spongiactinospora sp. TRM90649]
MRRIFGRRREPSPVGEESDDAALLAAVAEGNVTALRVLHDRHAPWLRIRLARRCADPDVVADALQDTFVAVWRGAAGRFRAPPGGGDAAAWLWTIAVRRLISTLRGRGHRWIGDGAEPGERHAITESAEDVVLLGVEHGDLGAAIARLSPELRAAVQATVLDGLTTREAARLLGVPEGTVKTRVRRAKARLREELS